MLGALTLSALVSLALPAQLEAPTRDSNESGAKTRLAIMALTSAGTPEEFSVGVTETIATTIAKTEVFETVSPSQIASLLAYEQRKDVLGGCDNAACFQQVGQIVRAHHIIGGSLARVGDKLVLNMMLIDTESGTALKRTERTTDSPAELLSESRSAAITLLGPLLSERRGFIKITSNVPDAEVFVDDERRIEGIGQVISLAAGPHAVRIVKDGFYSASADIMVRPGRVSSERVSLIPAKATIEDYESTANAMRVGAWVSGGASVASAVLAGVFYANASNDKSTVDTFANSLDIQQDPSARQSALEAKNSFETNQALYVGFLGSAIATGVTSMVLFIVGDDPGRYDEFSAMSD